MKSAGMLIVTGVLASCVVVQAEQTRRAGGTLPRSGTATEPLIRGGEPIVDNGIVLENEYLKARIATNIYAGQVMSLIYKPTGQELAPMTHRQGYFKDRMGEDRYFWRRKASKHAGRILPSGPDRVRAEVSYVWHYDYGGTQSTIHVTKTYTLRRGESMLSVDWRLENVGEHAVPMTPWLKHVGRRTDALLHGPTRTVGEPGPFDAPSGGFYDAVRNWTARQSGRTSSDRLPMTFSVTNFKQTYQQFPWAGKHRYTMEVVLRPITLKAGATWTTHHTLGVAANLGRVDFACPELAAGLVSMPADWLPGQQREVTVEIATVVPFGAVRLEGEVIRKNRGAVAALPRREVELVPGKRARVRYTFTPPQPDVYYLNLSLVRGQTPLPLGKAVKAQDSGIVIPLVIGRAHKAVMTRWKSEGAVWRRREVRNVQPTRVLGKSNGVSVAQVPVLQRVFPEDRIVTDTPVEPELTIYSARNEWESAQFVVSADERLKGALLWVGVGPLEDAAGRRLTELQLYEVKNVKTTIPSGYRRSFPVGQWPDPLYRAKPTDLKGGEHKAFWVTVHVPSLAPPGVYRGPLTVRFGKDTVIKGTFAVRVHKFALPTKPTLQTTTGNVGFVPGRIASNLKPMGYKFEKWQELMEPYVKMCAAYGWSPRHGGRPMWEKYRNHGRGMTTFHASPRDEAWLKQRGLLERAFRYAPFDEHANGEVPEVVKWARQWKAQTQIPVLDVFYGGNVEPLFGLVDIWCGQSPRQPWVAQRRKAGDRFWSVNNSLIWYIEYPPVQGRREFWYDFAFRMDGRLLYSNIRWSTCVFAENWSGGGNYLGCTIYPAPYGLTTSIRWETLRDGLEDHDYLVLLERALTAYRKAGRSDAAKEAEQARQIVSDPALSSQVDTPEKLLALRRRVAEMIEALSKEPKGDAD